jgi:hypothetical protein
MRHRFLAASDGRGMTAPAPLRRFPIVVCTAVLSAVMRQLPPHVHRVVKGQLQPFESPADFAWFVLLCAVIFGGAYALSGEDVAVLVFIPAVFATLLLDTLWARWKRNRHPSRSLPDKAVIPELLRARRERRK